MLTTWILQSFAAGVVLVAVAVFQQDPGRRKERVKGRFHTKAGS